MHGMNPNECCVIQFWDKRDVLRCRIEFLRVKQKRVYVCECFYFFVLVFACYMNGWFGLVWFGLQICVKLFFL